MYIDYGILYPTLSIIYYLLHLSHSVTAHPYILYLCVLGFVVELLDTAALSDLEA